MDPVRKTKEIDKPLSGGPIRAPRSLTVRTVLFALAAVAMLGASTAIAFRDRPHRVPAVVATSTPQAETAALETPPALREDTAKSGGPSIIKVPPPDAKPAGSGSIVIRDPSAIGQDTRVAHLPDRALIEMSEVGPLPVRGADGRRPMDVYARKWSGARGARVAIVIGGLGVSQTGTQAAIAKLPAEVTLAFASGGNSLDRWMQAARHEGHELLMQAPLEPFDYPSVDPGRNTLTVGADADENRSRLRWTLARTTNYTGIMNYMGGRFVTDAKAMGVVMDELGARGLLYLDDGTSARSVAPEQALAHRVPFAAADILIDADRSRGAILKKLDELERIARAKGSALGTGSGFDLTVDAVTSWVAEARKRGIEIVPVTALVNDPEQN